MTLNKPRNACAVNLALAPFRPSLCHIGDTAGSPSDGPPSKLCAHSTCRGLRMDGNGPNFFSHIKPVLSAFLLAFYLADASLFASAETGAAMIDIDRMTIGAPPAEFTFARTGRGAQGEWTVTADPTAAAGRAIEQTSIDRTDYRFPLAVPDEPFGRRCERGDSLQGGCGKVDQAGGVAVRFAGCRQLLCGPRQRA